MSILPFCCNYRVSGFMIGLIQEVQSFGIRLFPVSCDLNFLFLIRFQLCWFTRLKFSMNFDVNTFILVQNLIRPLKYVCISIGCYRVNCVIRYEWFQQFFCNLTHIYINICTMYMQNMYLHTHVCYYYCCCYCCRSYFCC